MTSTRGDSLYSMSVKVEMEIDGEGNRKVTDLDVEAGGYRDDRALRRTKKRYNAGKDMPEVIYEDDDWRKERFYYLWQGMKRVLKKKLS